MRAGIHARVSTTDQHCENQLAEVRRYCEARGWTIAREYVDRVSAGPRNAAPPSMTSPLSTNEDVLGGSGNRLFQVVEQRLRHRPVRRHLRADARSRRRAAPATLYPGERGRVRVQPAN